MVGPNAVVTAGHLLYDKNDYYGDNGSHWSFNVEVMPSHYKNNSGKFVAPFGTAFVRSAHCSTEWAENRANDQDWGILELGTNIGKMTGYLDLSYDMNNFGWNAPITVNGYPEKVNGVNVWGTQYTRDGGTNEWNDTIFKSYTAVVTPGDSGGPCLVGSKEKGYSVIGISIGCNGDYDDERQYHSIYRRINKALYDEILKYRASTL